MIMDARLLPIFPQDLPDSRRTVRYSSPRNDRQVHILMHGTIDMERASNQVWHRRQPERLCHTACYGALIAEIYATPRHLLEEIGDQPPFHLALICTVLVSIGFNQVLFLEKGELISDKKPGDNQDSPNDGSENQR